MVDYSGRVRGSHNLLKTIYKNLLNETEEIINNPKTESVDDINSTTTKGPDGT